MKRLVYQAAWAVCTLVLCAGAVAAGSPGGSFDALAARIHKASSTNQQSMYSRVLRKSVNAAAVRNLEQTCTQQHPGADVQTFTLVGVMRQDGVFMAPIPLPKNDFTSCMADQMASVNFPLPPGKQHGWPVAMQIDGKTGKVLYMAGDIQPALPQYRQAASTATPWLYTPVPVRPTHLGKPCAISVWLSVGVEGRVEEVDVADSSCPSAVRKAAVAAASQWLYLGTPGTRRDDSMDVRLSFDFGRSRVQVKL